VTEKPSTARQKILDAASSVFADEGFAGARVDEIARRAGVNKAMLYYHVGNKQALYTAVLARNFDHMEKALDEALASDASIHEQLEALIAGIARTLRDLPDHPRIVLREFASAGTNLQPEVLERMVKVLGKVRGLLHDGVENGQLRATDPVMTHLALVGASLILSSVSPLRQRVSEIDPEVGAAREDADVGEFLADLVLHGIATPGFGEAT
jgi:AcrR family transcriptional regulator